MVMEPAGAEDLEPASADFVAAVKSGPPLDWSVDKVQESRALIKESYQEYFTQASPGNVTSRRDCATAPSGRSVPLLIQSSVEEDAGHPASLYLHGGGWVSGDLESFEPFTQRIAASARAHIVSVGYSLAPEARFPVALISSSAT